MLRKPACLLVLLILCQCFSAAQTTRHFTFHYAFTVKDVPSGQRLRVWFPSAQSNDYQHVRVLSSKADLSLKKTRESRFGNEMYFAEASKAKGGDLHFEIVYDVVRYEHMTLGLIRPRLQNAALDKKDSQLYLSADKLVPITGKPAELAAQVTEGKNSQLTKARAIYDYVFANMSYDRSGTGWGHGDVLYACNAKKGNCTDFHSLFIAMARSQGIPARFEIGFPLAADNSSGEIPGYHCWAEFFDPQNGWVPIDISEAWQHPEKKDYYFGANDANRIQFSIGRDLKLNPSQQGEPLNYFVYPYAEVDGKEYPRVDMQFSFADAAEAPGQAATSNQ